MNTYLLLIVLVGIGFAGVCSAQNGTCDDPSTCSCDPEGVSVTPIEAIDLDEFAIPYWFVQEVYFRKPTVYVPLICHSLGIGRLFYWTWHTFLSDHYGLDGLGINLYNAYPDYDDDAVWDINNVVTQNKYRTIITHTDSVSYGVMHFCPYAGNLGITHEHIYTFTSTPDPDPALVAKLREMVADLGYPTDHVFKPPHYENCNYNGTKHQSDKNKQLLRHANLSFSA